MSSQNIFSSDTISGDILSTNQISVAGTADFFGNVNISENLTVEGSTTTIDTINVAVKDHNIELAVTDSPSDSTANGGGIILKGDSDKNLLWNSSSNAWESNVGLNIISGSVGIGTTNPTEALQVVGVVHATVPEDVNAYSRLTYGGGDTKVDGTGDNRLFQPAFIMHRVGEDGSSERTVSIHTDRESYINGGNVGIGTATPSSKLEVAGDIKAAGDVIAFSASDQRLKNNISNITNPISKLNQINGVNFEWSKDQSIHSGKDVGVIAQEVQKVLPEAVTERQDGNLAVKYEKIIPLLVEAIKDQQKQIEELKKKLS